MELNYEKLMPQEDLLKIRGYLESGDSAKVKIALAKIDGFILGYLKDLKYNQKISKLSTALLFLEQAWDNLKEEKEDNIVIKTVVEQFKVYKEMREKVSNITDAKIKEKIIRELKARLLWEI